METGTKLENYIVIGSFAGRGFRLEITAQNEEECRAIFTALLKIDTIAKAPSKIKVVGANSSEIMQALKKPFKILSKNVN